MRYYTREQLNNFDKLFEYEVTKVNNTIDLITGYSFGNENLKNNFSVIALEFYRERIIEQRDRYNKMTIGELAESDIEDLFGKRFDVLDVLKEDLFKKFINSIGRSNNEI